MAQDSALPLQVAAPNVNVPQNLVGPIGVVDPTRNLVSECDQESHRDWAIGIARRPCIANRPVVTDALFHNDVDGPRFMATLFRQTCVHDENELINVASVGASLTYVGGLYLWRNVATSLYFYDLLLPLDNSVDQVENDWISSLRMNNSSSSLSPLAAMTAKYNQFWKGSCSLADCSPKCSATGSIRCVATGGTNVFQSLVWTNEASTTIEGIPDADVYVALTYQFNLSPNDAGLNILNEGPFWVLFADIGEEPCFISGCGKNIRRNLQLQFKSSWQMAHGWFHSSTSNTVSKISMGLLMHQGVVDQGAIRYRQWVSRSKHRPG
ncbi:hypothetical protein HAX54_021099 [Datura stramonium]|uniref:Uncharacterized protein n=1 Tax=Datura stramonium TaxID=4076 RepID=A0ABS8UU53_DATST|nr:hypothetical protein [Datura stramonium]